MNRSAVGTDSELANGKLELDSPAYIHPTAVLLGNVEIQKGASVFAYSVIRSEAFAVVIGRGTNVQEFSMIHVGDFSGTQIGENCSLSYRCTLRGCTIEDNVLIGISSTVMDGAHIGANSIVAAHSYVEKNAVFEPDSVIAGVPAKVVGRRDCSAVAMVNARLYSVISKNYADGLERLSDAQLKEIADFVGQTMNGENAGGSKA
ncbi:MAG: gamma carbonic anhydrase family protein [Pseudomonadota bacterium]